MKEPEMIGSQNLAVVVALRGRIAGLEALLLEAFHDTHTQPLRAWRHRVDEHYRRFNRPNGDDS